jgi:Ca2+-binding RTX toxin-like protein
LTGNSGANQIVAGDGNDTLTGAGGADVLYGGRGDDTIVINASNITALAVNTGNASQAIARIVNRGTCAPGVPVVTCRDTAVRFAAKPAMP